MEKSLKDRKNGFVNFCKEHKFEIVLGGAAIATITIGAIIDHKLSDTTNESGIAFRYRGNTHLNYAKMLPGFIDAVGRADNLWYRSKDGIVIMAPTMDKLDRFADALKNETDAVPADMLKLATILVEYQKNKNN